MEKSKGDQNKLSLARLVVVLGIIYGDIGTSPIYTLNFIVGDKPITDQLVFGAISCVFWTLTLITTIKYIYLALNADNRGEGGIFALYALVRTAQGRLGDLPGNDWVLHIDCRRIYNARHKRLFGNRGNKIDQPANSDDGYSHSYSAITVCLSTIRVGIGRAKPLDQSWRFGS
jgi:hypothetical protein